jgi:hypothetical protein
MPVIRRTLGLAIVCLAASSRPAAEPPDVEALFNVAATTEPRQLRAVLFREIWTIPPAKK